MPRRPLYQTPQSYRRSLEELQKRLTAGVPLQFYDCEDIGAKNTACTLGLCDDQIEQAQDGVYRKDNQHCPHDAARFTVQGTVQTTDVQSSGCFYRCHIFQNTGRAPATIAVRIASALHQSGA